MNQTATAAHVAPAIEFPSYVNNQKLKEWVAQVAHLTKPADPVAIQNILTAPRSIAVASASV